MLSKGLSSAKHHGVRSMFHKEFVKTGVFEIELGQFYDSMFDNRQKSDYVDMVQFKSEDIELFKNEAEIFVDKLEIEIIKYLGSFHK